MLNETFHVSVIASNATMAPYEGSYFSFQPVLHDWCNKGHGMCYPVCGMVHIKEPLLLIDKSSGFPFSLSEWSLTICLMPYNRWWNVLSASLNKTFLSLTLWRYAPYKREIICDCQPILFNKEAKQRILFFHRSVVEHLPMMQCVIGSIPLSGTTEQLVFLVSAPQLV